MADQQQWHIEGQATATRTQVVQDTSGHAHGVTQAAVTDLGSGVTNIHGMEWDRDKNQPLRVANEYDETVVPAIQKLGSGGSAERRQLGATPADEGQATMPALQQQQKVQQPAAAAGGVGIAGPAPVAAQPAVAPVSASSDAEAIVKAGLVKSVVYRLHQEPEGPTLKEFRAGVAKRYNVAEDDVWFLDSVANEPLSFGTPLTSLTTRFIARVKEASSGQTKDWEMAFERGAAAGEMAPPAGTLPSELYTDAKLTMLPKATDAASASGGGGKAAEGVAGVGGGGGAGFEAGGVGDQLDVNDLVASGSGRAGGEAPATAAAPGSGDQAVSGAKRPRGDIATAVGEGEGGVGPQTPLKDEPAAKRRRGL